MKFNSINQKLIKNLIISGPALISNFDNAAKQRVVDETINQMGI